MPRPWIVQLKGDDDLFRTVEDGTHDGLHSAYWHYMEVADSGVALLLRGDRIVLRSDQPIDAPTTTHAQLF